MADYVFVGRARHPAKVATYQVLTLGIYGRVWMYKLLREFDGHEALFLNRRQYLPLLILPIIGPFFVKRRIARLVDHTIHHDVTSPDFQVRRALWLGVLPLAPLFHLYVTRVVNHHWKMHTKAEELELKKDQLTQLQRRKSPEAQAQAKALEKEVAQREKELQDLRSAALALREADALRRAAEREGGVRRSPLASLKKITAYNPLRKRQDITEEETPEDVPQAEEPVSELPDEGPARGGSKKQPAPNELDEAEPGPEPVAEAAPEPADEKPSFLSRFFQRKREPEAPEAAPEPKPRGKGRKPKAEDVAEPAEPDGLTKDEIKQLKAKAKEERQAAKLAAKEEKKKAKERRKADKKAAKEARKKAKLQAKEAKKKAKLQAKEEKKKAKEAARAAKEKTKAREKSKEKTKDTAANKKEKTPSKPKKGPAKRK